MSDFNERRYIRCYAFTKKKWLVKWMDYESNWALASNESVHQRFTGLQQIEAICKYLQIVSNCIFNLLLQFQLSEHFQLYEHLQASCSCLRMKLKIWNDDSDDRRRRYQRRECLFLELIDPILNFHIEILFSLFSFAYLCLNWI